MATGFDAVAKNSMLQGLKNWDPGAVSTAIYIAAHTTDTTAAPVAEVVATYSTPATGKMNITANVVINIPADNNIAHMRIMKNLSPNGYNIYKKDVTAMAFTYAGTITITSAEISLVDPV